VKLAKDELKQVDDTIKAVAHAESLRYYSTEHNSMERSLLVAATIAMAVDVALIDLYVSRGLTPLEALEKIMTEITTDDIILGVMREDGYKQASDAITRD
jgi:hypothetical protein